MSDERELPPREEIDPVLDAVSEEYGLEPWYRDCVRPLLRQPEEQWPSCCGGGCDPCTQVLVEVARRTLIKLGR